MKRNTRLLPAPLVRMAGLIAGSVLLASVAWAVNNPHYDAKATTGALQTVCYDLAINSGVLSAKCNKVEADNLIGQVDASIDLEIDERCRDGAKISVTENAVTLTGDCEVPPGAESFSIVETDLNDHIEWVQSESKFRWKDTTAGRALSTGNLTA